MSLAPGALVSHYRLVRQLGVGGMGEVHLAQDLQLDRQVAIKFLTSPDDHLGRKRLLNEARVAASLDHHAICAVYEVGSDPVGGDFIVMQYVEGEPLSTRLRRGRLTSAEAIAICLEIADGLRAAHRRGVIHRDLKPHNIIITPSGHPKLLDFGIATRTAPPVSSDAATDSAATQPDDKMGTPAYMAPEQVRGYAVDFRTDLFAFGCVLFECLTGRRAFSGPTTADIQAQVISTNPPPPSTIAPELGVAYDALCARLLHKEPAQRMQSADELVGALQALAPITGSLSGQTPSQITRGAADAAWSVRQKTTAAITAIAAIVIVAGSWWWYRGRDLPAPPADARVWYESGVDALREGTYFGAKTALEEAVRVFPAYAEAWSRLAEAYAELDDEASAQSALLRVSTLVPDSGRLRNEIRLRLNAVRFSVLRDRDAATAAYQTLVEARPDDEGAWVDLGRAHEASGQMALARENYTKALALKPMYAEAHLRLGALPGLAAAKALPEIDEAIREYRIGMKTEGECEALLRKGIVLAAVKKTAEARDILNQVVALGADARFTSQRLRAQFELTRLTAAAGQFSDAKALGQRTVDEAMKAGLQRIAANGLIDLAGALLDAGQFDEADRTLVEATAMAAKQGARLTEMRGRLQQAAGRLAAGREADAIALCAEPLQYFGGGRHPRFEATTKNVLSRAHENLGHYDEASRLTTEVLKFAEGIGDDAQIAVALANLAGQYTKRGRLPEALDAWLRVEQLHTKAEDHSALRRDLTNRAELLVLLGRGDDATKVLDEIERRMKAGNEAYADRGPRIALLRALLAATQGRFADVAPLAVTAGVETNAAGLVPLARILREYGRAQLGTSVEKPRAMLDWARDPSTLDVRPDFVYWTARTLIARRENLTAYQLVTEALTLPSVAGSLELTWRLTAVAALAARGLAVSPDSAAMAGRSEKAADDIDAAWHADARRYFARPDLTALRPNRS